MRLVTLCTDYVFQATAKAADTVFDAYLVSGKDIELIGAQLADIVIHAEGSNFTPNFSYKVSLQYRYNSGNWQEVQPLPVQSNGDYKTSTAMADRTKLGLRIRIVVQTQVTAGSSKTEHGSLSLTAALHYLT